MATNNKPAATKPTTNRTATVQVQGAVVNSGSTDAELKEVEKLDKESEATALQLRELNDQANAGATINTDNKDSDADLPMKQGSVTKKNTKVDADEVGSKENKIGHEISGKLVYETAADFQASLKKEK